MFNLIEERWIKVRTESGAIREIAPWEICSGDDRPVEVCFERPDFSSVVTQFLIALYQTVYTPKDEDEWLDRIEEPPSVDECRRMLSSIEQSFELLGDGHRYMQDVTVGSDKAKPIARMLMTSPGENTIRTNKDFFVKRGSDPGCMCLPCTAAALTCMQMIGGQGGSGLRASARGSSAVTVLVTGKDLWETVYLNVLSVQRLKQTGGDGISGPKFPWMNDENDGTVMPQGNSPVMILWSMVRRILLSSPRDGVCGICGRRGPCIYEYSEEKHGNEYRGWIHPFAPMSIRKDSVFPASMTADYRHFNQWASVAYDLGTDTKPSLNVIQAMSNRGSLDEIMGGRYRIRITGYQNKQASSEYWVDISIPVYIGYDDEAEFNSMVSEMLETSNNARKALGAALNSAFGGGQGPKASASQKISMDAVSQNYWNECDPIFSSELQRYRPEDVEEIEGDWRKSVYSVALRIFDECTSTIDYRDYDHVVLSRVKLQRSQYPKSKGVSKK